MEDPTGWEDDFEKKWDEIDDQLVEDGWTARKISCFLAASYLYYLKALIKGGFFKKEGLIKIQEGMVEIFAKLINAEKN